MAFKLKGWSPFTQKEDKKKKETKEDRLTKSMKLHKGEDKDTFVPEGKQPMYELIGDIEDRIEFLQSDLEDGGQQPGQNPEDIKKDIEDLKKELSTIRNTEDRPDPTYEGTDEYRKEKDIPKSEFKARGIKKSKK